MINFIDEYGKQHAAIVECQKTKGVNGEKSLSGTIYTNDEILEGIGRGWRLQFEDENYCLTYVNPLDEGNRIVVEFDAVHEFFFDLRKSVIYSEMNGSNTANAYLQFIFNGSGYEYRLEVTIPAFEKESFGMKNRLDLFKDFISSTGVEFSVNGKIVRILEKVGTNLSTVVKKGFNLNELRLEKDPGSFITYLRGYGAFVDPDDESKGRLIVEYLSPLAEVFGKLEGDPVIDERYTVDNNLIERLKSDVENSYGISVDIDMEDLTRAGYDYDQPHEGDYIMAINKDLGFEQKIRIMSYTTSYDTEGNIIDHDVSCGSDNIIQKKINQENEYRKEVQAGLENAISTANQAWISADGKNKIFQGPDRPTATNKGDIWYQEDGEQTIMNYWNGFDWVPFINPDAVKESVEQAKQAGENAQEAADQAKTDSANALSNANNAISKANEAGAKADQSNAAANQAKSDAASAITNANTAKQDAQLAVSNAQNALNAANSAKTDAQAAIDKYNDLGMFPAWAWSADGTDRFTDVYPGENLLDNPFATSGISWDSEAPDAPADNFDIGNNSNYQYLLRFGMGSLYSTLSAGDVITISFDVEMEKGTSLRVYDSNTSQKFTIGTKNFSNIGTENTRLSFTATVSENGKGGDRWILEFYNGNNGDKFSISKLKIEYGEVATPYTPSPSIDFTNAYPTYIGFSNVKSTNPSDYTWIKDPNKVDGEVKVELSEINGELSRKVSQDKFNTLEGTVENQTTKITQNTNAITQKADSTTVNTLTGRVSTAEGQITTMAGQIEIKANKTDVDTISGKVTSVESSLNTQAGQITALNTKTDGHTTQIGSLQSSYSGLSSTVSSVKNDLDNLSVGARNYLPNSESPKMINHLGSQITYTENQTVTEWKATNAVKHVVTGGTSLVIGTLRANRTVTANVNYIHSIYIYNTGDTQITIGNNLGLTEDVPSGTIKRLVFSPRMSTTGNSSMQFVFNRGTVEESCEFIIWHAMIAEGTIVNDWVPSPEDQVSMVEFSSFVQRVDTIQTTVSNKADQSQVTQLANQWQQTTDLANGHTSQISSLGDQLNVRVQKDDVINQINLSTEEILIAGNKVRITGQTTIEDGVIGRAQIANLAVGTAQIADAAITDAKIGSLSATKITTGTLNASNVNIINLNANSITTGTISGTNLSINLATGEVIFNKGIIKNLDDTFQMNITTGVTSSRGEYVSPNGTGNTLAAGYNLMNGKIEFYAGTFGETSVPYGGLDTETHSGQYYSGSSWQRGEWSGSRPAIALKMASAEPTIWQSRSRAVVLSSSDYLEPAQTYITGNTYTDGYATGSNPGQQVMVGAGMGVNQTMTEAVDESGGMPSRAWMFGRHGVTIASGYSYESMINGGYKIIPSLSLGTTRVYSGAGDSIKRLAATATLQAGYEVVVRGRNVSMMTGSDGTFSVNSRRTDINTGGGSSATYGGMSFGSDGSGRVWSMAIYNRTYAAGNGDLCITSAGTLGRKTSARKYKADIKTADEVIAHAKEFLTIKPASWYDKKEYANGTAVDRFYGFIADEFHEKGLTEVVYYGDKGQVEGLAYDRLTMYQNVILSDHEREIQSLKKEVNQLKNKVRELEAA